MAARASYIAGFAGTATVLAGEQFGIPLYGTMAHSFIESFDDETAAFEAFARARPDNLVLLLDTYDTEAAARKVVALAPRLKAPGITIRGVRLDSGDLVALSQTRARTSSMPGGLADVTIFASGGLDEDSLAAFARAECADRRHRHRHQPHHVVGRAGGRLRLQIAGICRPAAAQALGEQGDLAGPQAGMAALWRRRPHGRRHPGARRPAANRGEPLIQPVMHGGRRLRPPESLADIRPRAKRELERLPEPLRRLEPDATYPVEVADELVKLAAEVDRRLQVASSAAHESPVMSERAKFGDDDVLIIVDVQNDFCPGGALAVPRGDEVIPIVNRPRRAVPQCGADAGLASARTLLVRLVASRQATLTRRSPRPTARKCCGRTIACRRRRAPNFTPGCMRRMRLWSCARASSRDRFLLGASTRMTARRRPALSATCASAVSPACSLPGSRSIFACAIRPRTRGARASMPSWSRTPAAVSTSTAPWPRPRKLRRARRPLH